MAAEAVIDTLSGEGYCIVATDYYPASYNPISKRCSAFYQMPLASDASYGDALLQVAQEHACEAILPLTDPEVDVLSARRAMFDEAGIQLWSAPSSVVATARNKRAWGERFKGAQHFRVIPTFLTYNELVANTSGRYVAKRVNGRSSEGILFSETSSVVLRDEEGCIFQPFIEGEICTVDFAVHPNTAEVVCVPRVELLRTKNGAGTVVRIERGETFRAAIEELVASLGLCGVMNCEFIRDAQGQLWLMDINPRFSAGVAFSRLAGYDMVRACIECFTKPSLTSCKEIKEGQIFVKRYVEFVG